MRDISKEIHLNFFNWLEDLAQLTSHKYFKSDAIRMLNSNLPHPMYSYICINYEEDMNKQDLDACIDSLIEGNTPFFLNNGIWYNNKTSGDYLIERKLDSLGHLDGMCFDLEQTIPDSISSDDLTIRIVQSQKDHRDFAEVMAAAAEIEPSIGRKFFANYSKSERDPFILLIGYSNDKPIACSMIYTPEKDIAGNYYDWVLPEYRQRGVNSTMVIERLKLAKDKGYKFVIAQCMDTSTRLYAGLGFEKVCELDFYGKMSYES